MKTVAVIALILLLVVSLGTSVYLLLDQKKAQAKIEETQKNANEKLKSAKSKVDDMEKKFQVASDKTATLEADKAKLKSDLISLEGGVAGAKKLQDDLQLQLENAKDNQNTLIDEITILGSTNKTVAAKLETAQSKLESLGQQLIDLEKQVEDKSKKLEEAQETLEPFIKLGLAPDKILELSKKSPVKLKVPEISGPKPRIPGKLRKTLVTPSPAGPQKPSPAIKPEPQLKENE